MSFTIARLKKCFFLFLKCLIVFNLGNEKFWKMLLTFLLTIIEIEIIILLKHFQIFLHLQLLKCPLFISQEAASSTSRLITELVVSHQVD